MYIHDAPAYRWPEATSWPNAKLQYRKKDSSGYEVILTPSSFTLDFYMQMLGGKKDALSGAWYVPLNKKLHEDIINFCKQMRATPIANPDCIGCTFDDIDG